MKGRVKTRAGRQGGFSLLEIMIALAILSFSMMAILTMVTTASATQQAARESEIAKEAAMAQVAKVRMAGFDAVAGFQGASFVVEGLSDPARSDKKARGTVAIDGSNPDLLQIVVTVTWKGRKGDSSYSMRGLCAR